MPFKQNSYFWERASQKSDLFTRFCRQQWFVFILWLVILAAVTHLSDLTTTTTTTKKQTIYFQLRKSLIQSDDATGQSAFYGDSGRDPNSFHHVALSSWRTSSHTAREQNSTENGTVGFSIGTEPVRCMHIEKDLF